MIIKKVNFLFVFGACLFGIFLFLSTATLGSAVQQSKNNKVSTSSKEQIAYFQQLYSLAYELKDLQTAKFCLLNLILLDNSDTASLAQLAKLYFETNEYASAVKAAKKYYAVNSANAEIVKIIALSNEKTANFSDALISFTELYYLTKDITYQYKAANMEYELFRYREALQTLQLVLNTADSKGKNIVLIDASDNSSQMVPLSAAAYNLMGLVYLDQKDRESARQSFSTALSIHPGFVLAQKNLEFVSK